MQILISFAPAIASCAEWGTRATRCSDRLFFRRCQR